MQYEKVRLRKAKGNVYYPGDLLYYKKRNCEVTIIGCDTIFGGYKVIFHDSLLVGNLPAENIKYLYHICKA